MGCPIQNFNKKILPSLIKTKQCCSLNITLLPKGRLLPGSSPRNKVLLPSWINFTKAVQGQNFAKENTIFYFWGQYIGLLNLFAFPDINEILLMSEGSDRLTKAIKRYISNGAQSWIWIASLPNNPTEFTKSIFNTRKMHKKIAKLAEIKLSAGSPLYNEQFVQNTTFDDQLWEAVKEDFESSNIPKEFRDYPSEYYDYGQFGQPENKIRPVNQFSQSLTVFAFMGFPILYPERFFIHDASDEDLDNLLHLWAVLGYAFGINDEFNICLQPDFQSRKAYFQEVLNHYFTPNMFKIDAKSKVLLEAIMKGMHQFYPSFALLNPRLTMYFIAKNVYQVQADHVYAILTVREKRDYNSAVRMLEIAGRDNNTKTAFNRDFLGLLQYGVVRYFGNYLNNCQWAHYVFYSPLVNNTKLYKYK